MKKILFIAFVFLFPRTSYGFEALSFLNYLLPTASLQYAYPRKSFGTGGIVIGFCHDFHDLTYPKGLLIESTFGAHDYGYSLGWSKYNMDVGGGVFLNKNNIFKSKK